MLEAINLKNDYQQHETLILNYDSVLPAWDTYLEI